MQYTDHYNLNLPEGSDIVNPLIQDNPNYTAIDNALYANKLRVVGNATETKTGITHTITRLDSDIPAFKFVASGDYDSGDIFTVDGVTVTARAANNRALNNKCFVINSTVLCILDGTILNIIGAETQPHDVPASEVYDGGIKVSDILGQFKTLDVSIAQTIPANGEIYVNLNTIRTNNDFVMGCSIIDSNPWVFYELGQYATYHVVKIKNPSGNPIDLTNATLRVLYYNSL